jgi:hypothetical protein
MAYMSQERKAEIAPVVKALLKQYGLKGSLSVDHHSTLVLNISAGSLDFIGSYNRIGAKRSDNGSGPAKDSMSVNRYWYHEHFDGEALEFLSKLVPAMNLGNHDRSDIQSDYFDVGWYVDVKIGRWNKPYQLLAKGAA